MFVDWGIITPIFIAIFSAVGIFAYNDFKTFEFYVKYFYLLSFSILIFLLGWNSAMLVSLDKSFLINWWLILILFLFIVFIKVMFEISKTKFYKSHTSPW